MVQRDNEIYCLHRERTRLPKTVVATERGHCLSMADRSRREVL
jgi:hypothetical protein